jgi:hypothetical protein
MSLLDALYHLVNFAMPAVFVGGALALFGRRHSKRAVRTSWLINSAVGIVAMFAGLMFFGADGKILSYTLLVMACSLVQLFQQSAQSR